MNLNSSPERHRGTEKSEKSIDYRYHTIHPAGERQQRHKALVYLGVLCVSVVQLRFSG